MVVVIWDVNRACGVQESPKILKHIRAKVLTHAFRLKISPCASATNI